jgi:hypothetical protein
MVCKYQRIDKRKVKREVVSSELKMVFLPINDRFDM